MESIKENQDISTESRGKYLLAAFLAPIIWGFMPIAVRSIKKFPAEDILYFRIITALVILLIFIGLFRRKHLRNDLILFRSLTRKQQLQLSSLVLLSAIFIFGNWYSYIYTVNHISIQAAAFGYLLCPLITTFTAFFLLKEKLSPVKWIALFIAFISVCLLSSGSFIEVVWAITIGALYAFYLIISRVIKGIDKLNMLAIQMILCMLVVIPNLIINAHAIPTETVFWNTTVILAVLFTIIPLYLSIYALNRISSSTVGILLYVNPIIAFSVAIFYFQEQVDPHKYIAYAILAIAIILFNSQTLFSRYVDKFTVQR